ncbi:DsbA family oxidoreductase [Brevibacillus fulvus]|uniref:DsbA family dithiol-disulfide isomerase n=1 Tax=Brevibacillus fulvus TaxID=1125967 RepID=A0A938XQT6_9BACL|nr:DsbA family oxidoreductase [Brevibacillus fulvus]MBM7588428.1 putative DsbA family dithiol-disulfide isomerase [Brevibacillus fulvus]
MIIDVFQDTVCPWCRIGKKNLMDALAQWQGEPVTIRYRAFFLDPGVPKEGLPFHETMQAITGGNLDEALARITEAGEAVGLNFRYDRVQKRPNTVASHILIKLTPEEKASDIVEAIYKAYFEDGLDIGDLDVLVKIAEENGLDGEQIREQILSDEAQDDLEEDLSIAQELQITGVPLFVFDEKLALSGAHPVINFLKALETVAEEEA